MIKKLMPFVKGYTRQTLLTPVFVIIEVLLEIFIPITMSKLIDIGITNRDIAYVCYMGGVMVMLAVLSLISGALSGRFAAVASAGFAKNLRQRLFYAVQDFSFSNMDKFSTASLVTRLTTDVTNTQNTFMMLIRMFIRAPIMLISATIMAFSINAELALIFFVAVPVLGIALYFIATTAYPRFRSMLKSYDRLNAIVQESLMAIRAVKAFVRGNYEDEKFAGIADEVRTKQVRAEKVIIFNMPIMQFTMYGCMIAISWFGGNLIIGGSMTTGELMSFISYVSQILMSLMMISMVFVMFVLSRASIFRILEVLDEKPDIADSECTDVSDGSVVFENVSFGYGGKDSTPVLQDINLTISSGETVGIIGTTGSAKTTLVQLIPRLYDVTAGRVLVGGRDVRQYSLHALRNAVSMVLQKNVLFSGTIKENLKWGDEAATDEEIVQACKAAQAHDFVSSFPDGYDTNLGQGGVNLSGGQKQRLCIARALLKKPKIIILDDSTSAVDTATDKKIQQAFEQDLQDTTAIIIAQRISSIESCDKIIVIDDGKINAVGTHEELLAHNEIYREVYESQQKGVA